MSTFSALQTRVSRAIKDPTNQTFTLQEVADMLNEGIAEVSRLAPKQFLESVTVVADTLDYTLAAGASPEVEVKRVEVWDISKNPDEWVATLQPASAEYEFNSQAGWDYYAGKLRLTNATEKALTPGTHELRVRGFAPYTTADIASAAGTDVGMSNEIEKAVIAFCRVTAFSRLAHERGLFTQWQVDSHNTDTSLASVLGALSEARDDWRRLSRQITVLR